jgi:hypothetical protein
MDDHRLPQSRPIADDAGQLARGDGNGGRRVRVRLTEQQVQHLQRISTHHYNAMPIERVIAQLITESGEARSGDHEHA